MVKTGKSLYSDARGVRQSLEKAGGQLPQFQRARALTEGFGKELFSDRHTLIAVVVGMKYKAVKSSAIQTVDRFCGG